MPDVVHIVNESEASRRSRERGQWDKLLGNGSASAPVIVPATSSTLSVPKAANNRRNSASNGSILGSFQRSFRMSRDGHGSHVFSRYRQSRCNARRIRKRVVLKHGDCNVVQGNVAKRRRKYLQDIFTTLVDAQWRWTLLVFSMNFLLSWLAFAVLWWFISFTHGDLTIENMNNATWNPCITNIKGFTSCFLYSVETQHTIGYGGRTPTEECPEAIFVMCLQSITGVMIQAFMVGVVFAKLSRPKKRTQTLLFSRNSVVCHRDGILCLMFRVGDMRKSHIIEAHVRAQLIRHKVTKEGESLPFYQTELKVGGDGADDKIFFIWPTTIVHKIDKFSPLYQLSATDLLRERFEIVVILEGVIESTGMTTQARSSYLPSEILWGHRFQPLVTFKSDSGEYEVDYELFNHTIEVDTPLSSAKQLDELGVVEHRLNGVFHARSASSNTLSSMDSMSMDCDHHPIEITVPEYKHPTRANTVPLMQSVVMHQERVPLRHDTDVHEDSSSALTIAAVPRRMSLVVQPVAV